MALEIQTESSPVSRQECKVILAELISMSALAANIV